ncbi:MAG TPA: tetraacyldisaccharide 4'-kinase [Burkholderiaceae bacterium]|nr:tetraacyldisaccharide 4'-kinase [Burkholderiaceae bacterium]
MNAFSDLMPRIHTAWQRKGVTSTLLWPLSWIVRAAIARKRLRYRQQPQLTYHTDIPVVVVGNIYVGGTGKTPIVIALVQALQAMGWHPGVISRGYGVDVGKKPRAGRGELLARHFGDEPSLIARATQAPVAVHPSRVAALKKLRSDYPEVDIIVADDGLQHLALGRDMEIVVQDARGIGNGRVLPAGPLREPPSRLAYVDVIITNLEASQPEPPALRSPARQLSMRLEPDHVVHLVSGKAMPWHEWLSAHQGVSVSAVAAIGRPERFFAMLRAGGLDLAHALSLPDHHAYADSPFANLTTDCILITAKDAVKCERFKDERLWVVKAAPRFSDPDWMADAEAMLRTVALKKAAMAAGSDRH